MKFSEAKVLKIHVALYDVFTKPTLISCRCPNDIGNQQVTGCTASGSDDIIENLCQGKQSCVINPDNSVFGDPCDGTVKYVEIDYDCVAASAPVNPGR